MEKTPLLGNIKTEKRGMNEAAPGSAYAFYPNLNDKTGKPWIAVAGDGSTKVHVLVPNKNDKNDWTYTEKVPLDTKGTVGQMLLVISTVTIKLKLLFLHTMNIQSMF